MSEKPNSKKAKPYPYGDTAPNVGRPKCYLRFNDRSPYCYECDLKDECNCESVNCFGSIAVDDEDCIKCPSYVKCGKETAKYEKHREKYVRNLIGKSDRLLNAVAKIETMIDAAKNPSKTSDFISSPKCFGKRMNWYNCSKCYHVSACEHETNENQTSEDVPYCFGSYANQKNALTKCAGCSDAKRCKGVTKPGCFGDFSASISLCKKCSFKVKCEDETLNELSDGLDDLGVDYRDCYEDYEADLKTCKSCLLRTQCKKGTPMPDCFGDVEGESCKKGGKPCAFVYACIETKEYDEEVADETDTDEEADTEYNDDDNEDDEYDAEYPEEDVDYEKSIAKKPKPKPKKPKKKARENAPKTAAEMLNGRRVMDLE